MVPEHARRITPFIAMDLLERSNHLDDTTHPHVGKPGVTPPAGAVETAVSRNTGIH